MRLLLLFSIVFFIGCNSNNNTKHETTNITAQKNWIGEWERMEFQNNATLTIKRTESDSIIFEISAASGGNTGGIDGKAIVKGKKATFFSLDDGDTCLIELELIGDSLITLNQIKGNCGAGLGVQYSGNYYNSKTATMARAKNDKSPENINLLDDSLDNNLLKSLVGKDYDLFVSSTQLTSEDEDIDSLGSKVYSSGVRGLFTELENIIMINGKKDIWAAVIDDSVVNYYTNRKDFKDKLPKTIEHWRELFKERPVVYKSL